MRADDHPHDARLIARYFEPTARDERLERHVNTCAVCAAREREIAAVLADEHARGHEDGAPQLAQIRLAAQRRRIHERLDMGERRRARVIAFPTATAPAVSSRPVLTMRSRMAAVATILALVSAAGAGWVIEMQRHDGLRFTAESRRPAPPPAPRSPNGHEALLSDIEMALARPHTPALRALDALTPRAAETLAGR